MANNGSGNGNGGGYRTIRQALAALLLSVSALMVTADSLGIGRRTDPIILIIVGSFGLTLLGIDAPDIIRDIATRRSNGKSKDSGDDLGT